MFGGKGKKNGDERIPPENNNILSVRGALVSSVRFRGWVCLGLLVICILSLCSTVCMSMQKKIVVGIDGDGRPHLLTASSQNIELDLYVRDCVGRLMSFSRSNVDDNVAYLSKMSTEQFIKSWELNMGGAFIRGVKEYDVVQIFTVDKVIVESLSDKGFTAKVYGSKLRSDNLVKKVVPLQEVLTISAMKGDITKNNPWGYYINAVKEDALN